MTAGYRIEGIILFSKPLGEKDRVLTVLTPDRGLVRLSVRGGRSTGSRLAALALPFSRVRLDAWRGKSLDGLRGGEVLDAHRGLREDPGTIAHSFCIAEIVGRLAQEGEADRALYLLVVTAFRLLEVADPDLVMAFFLVRSTKVAGLFPPLDACRGCGGPIDGGFLSFEDGSISCPGCPPGPPPGHNMTAEMVSLARRMRDLHPRDVPDLSPSPGALVQLRNLLLDYLEYHLGRSVNSRRFLDILA